MLEVSRNGMSPIFFFASQKDTKGKTLQDVSWPKWIHIASSKEDLDVEATPAEDLEL